MKFTSDVDIDFADRQQILKLIQHIPASIVNNGSFTAHNTGVYVTSIPQDPESGRASLDYRRAEDRGYVKLDFLNVHVYQQIKDPETLDCLLQQEPPWHRLYEQAFCEQLIHLGRHHSTIMRMPEPVNTIARLAMLLAVIRPSKRHLIGLPWAQVSETVWAKDADGGYGFKKSHSIGYAHLVAVHMNLLNLTNQSN